MNYYEMSDDKINELTTIAVIKQTFKNVKSVERDGHMNYVWVEVAGFSSQPILDYCNNPADWGKLMQDNKISLIWWHDDSIEDSYWGANTKMRWQSCNHPTSPGRAVSICYLKMKEANNG